LTSPDIREDAAVLELVAAAEWNRLDGEMEKFDGREDPGFNAQGCATRDLDAIECAETMLWLSGGSNPLSRQSHAAMRSR
jgi:hypothetical protein